MKPHEEDKIEALKAVCKRAFELLQEMGQAQPHEVYTFQKRVEDVLVGGFTEEARPQPHTSKKKGEQAMKPHEETWNFDEPARVRIGEDDIGEFETGDYDHADARAKLAAQAPAMARLLLDMHERGSFDGCHDDRAVAAVLKAAGVLP